MLANYQITKTDPWGREISFIAYIIQPKAKMKSFRFINNRPLNTFDSNFEDTVEDVIKFGFYKKGRVFIAMFVPYPELYFQKLTPAILLKKGEAFILNAEYIQIEKLKTK